ncbi:MAG TPA: hypothetical protein VGM75_08190 [Pseudonocardiaceae bacterium]
MPPTSTADNLLCHTQARAARIAVSASDPASARLSIPRETVGSAARPERAGAPVRLLPVLHNFGFSGLTASQPDVSGNVTVGFTVTNTGKVAGQYRGAAEQLLTKPAQGPGDKSGALRGFQSISAVAWANWAV